MKYTRSCLILRVTCLVCWLGMALVAIAAQGQTFAYVADTDSNSVSVIDTTSNKLIDTVAVGDNPIGVAITPDGSRAYVTNPFSNSVSVIDTATNSVTATVSTENPYGAAITPNGFRSEERRVGKECRSR